MWRNNKGTIFFGVVSYIVLLCAGLLAVLIYQFLMNTGFSVNMRKYEYGHYLYDAGLTRGRYEVLMNPEIWGKIEKLGRYVIQDFVVDGVSMNIIISNTDSETGMLNIDVELPM